MTWQRLGPREKHLLAILRDSDDAMTARQVLEAARDDGASIAYTTVSTVLDRLVEKDVLAREAEVHAGSRRYRYAFEPEAHARSFVTSVLDDVERVLGDDGLDRLATRAERRLAAEGP